MGLLKSSTGKPEGPYVPAYSGNHALVSPNIDASLFQDDDGSTYFLWQGRYLRKLNADLSGFDGERVELLTVDREQVGYEGIFLRKIGKWYVLLAAEWNGGGNRAGRHLRHDVQRVAQPAGPVFAAARRSSPWRP